VLLLWPLSIKAGRPRTKLRDRKRTSQHTQVFEEHNLLDLPHHGIAHGPELVHHQRDRYQEECDQPCSQFRALAKQNTQASRQRKETGNRDYDGSPGHALAGSIGDRSP